MKLYTKTVCPTCIWVKSEVKRTGLNVDEINIEKNETAKETIRNAGFLSVPVLEYEGEFIGDAKEIITRIELYRQ